MRGGMKRGGATLEEMKQALKGKLFIGKKVKVIMQTFENGHKRTDGKRSGVVTELCPYIFVVDFGRYRESFRYAQVFERESEMVRL